MDVKQTVVNRRRVTLVPTAQVASFLGVDQSEVRRQLRRLRDEGKLNHEPGRLTARRRVGKKHVRCVMLRGHKRWAK